PEDSPLRDELPDKSVYSVEASLSNTSWDMYFDGATRTNEKGNQISGIGILFVSPDKYMIPHAFSLLEPCSNNAAEYQALIVGLELALESGITVLEAFGDSQLIINQMNQKYEIRKPDLLPYYNKAQSLRQKFDICHITHIRRGENIRADALAGLAASMAVQEGEHMQITVCERRILPPLNTHEAAAECHQVVGSRISILRPPI
ncbi:ribonuclease HI family protein, partial [Modestobacter lapidis]|nr:ribonuclease HI family protein [Modestobacter lapidis]